MTIRWESMCNFNIFFRVICSVLTIVSFAIANVGNGVHTANIPNSEFNSKDRIIMLDNSITSTNTQFGPLNEGDTKDKSSIEAKGEPEEKGVMSNIRQTFSEPSFYTDVNAKITDIAKTQNLASSVGDNAILTATSNVQSDIITMISGDQNDSIMMVGGRDDVNFFIGDYYYTFTPLSEEETREPGALLQDIVRDKQQQQQQHPERLEYTLLKMMDEGEMGQLLRSIPNEEHHKQQKSQHKWRVQRTPKCGLIHNNNDDVSTFSSTSPSPQLLSKGGRRLEIENADVGRNDNNYDNSNQSEHQTHQPNDRVQDENENSNLVFILSNSLLSLTCVIFAALAAGLTMGLLSLDPLSLEIKRRASVYSAERKQSAELLPLLVGHGRKHRLLVSLLILNSLANEALPLFLDELLPGKYASILVSVTLVLFFGEIVPSAFFTGPNQVKVAAKLVPVVKVVMFLLAPIAIPIAKLLDYVLHEGDDQAGGSHGENLDEVDVTGGTHYDRSELTALVRIQHEAHLAKKRRTKLLNQKMLASTNAGQPHAKRGARITIATSHHPNHPPLGRLGTLTSQGSHASSTTNNSIRNNVNSNSVRNDVRLAHHSIRSISRELTSSANSSTRKIDGRGRNSPTPNYSHYHATPATTSSYTPKRMPSIHADEITMIEGALAMTTKVAADVATPLRRVYALPADTILDEETVVEIWARGFSRVPVFVRSKEVENDDDGDASPYDEDVSSIMGVLLVRQLIVVYANENRPLATLPLAVPPCVAPSIHLVDLINLFQAGGGRGRGGIHLAVVCARPLIATEALERGECVPKEAGVIGIVTLEDVVEELLQEEIYDEYDRDLELAHWGVEKWKSFVQRKKSNRLHLHDDDTSGVEGESSGPRVTISNASGVDIEAPTTETSSLLDAVATWQDIAE